LSESTCSDDDIVDRIAAIARLREFLTAFHAVATAWETAWAPRARPSPRTRFLVASDGPEALWAGLRAALALVLVATFWIEADWASGPGAVVLATVITSRLSTMEHALRATIGGTIASVLAALPAFLVVEVALPRASGFAMFALVVAPMLLACAFLMARQKTAGLGFITGLFFANAGAFQNRMAYDPIGFVNTAIAFTLAMAIASMLFAIVAPDSAQGARRRFASTTRRALDRISSDQRLLAPRAITLTAFETVVGDALHQLRRALPPGEDAAAIAASRVPLACGRELIRVRDDAPATSDAPHDKRAVEAAVVRALVSREDPTALEHALCVVRKAIAARVMALREDTLGIAAARASVREMVAYAAIRDALAPGMDRPSIAPAPRRLAHAA
jgi:uncharacterized membrane protein YccC